MMKMLRKLIFLGVLINLVMLSSCKSDDLYQNFEDEQEKFINMFAKSSGNAMPIKSDSDFYQRNVPYGIVEEEDDSGEVGGEKQDENFRLPFIYKREYREKNRLSGNEGEDPKGKKKAFQSCLF